MAAHLERRRKQPLETVLGRPLGPQASRVTALSPVHTPSPWSGSPGAHPPAHCRMVREKQSRGEAGGPWGMLPVCGSPTRVRMVTLEVAYLLTNKATMTPRQASPTPASGLPQAPRPQRPTVHLPKGFLRPYCAPGPRTRCAGTWAAPTAFHHPDLHLGPLSLLIVDKHSSIHMFPVTDYLASSSLNIHSPSLVWAWVLLSRQPRGEGTVRPIAQMRKMRLSE